MRLVKGYKRWMAALAAGTLLSLTGAGNVMAAQGGRWELHNNQWYYYDNAGNRLTGWIKVDGKHYYLAADGHCLMNTVTPDGYYVSPSGEWFVRTTTIMDMEFTCYNKVPSVNETWSGKREMGYLDDELEYIFQDRDIKITDTSMEYVRGDGEEVLIGIYKNKDTGAYRLKLAIGLVKGSTSDKKMETYDYAVFRALLYQVTSTPELLEDAVYSSWEEDNRYQIQRNDTVQIGDSQVKYSADNGCGYYYIYPMR